MQNPTYLQLSRHNVYYLRYPVPKPLHPRGKCSDVKLSLGTREPRVALQLARLLSYQGHQLLNVILGDGSNGKMRYDEIRALLKKHFTGLLERRKAAIAENGRLSESDRAIIQSSLLVATDAEMFHAVGEGEMSPVDRLIAKYGLSVSKGSQTYQTLEKELQRSYSGYYQHVLDYDQSLEDYDFSDSPKNAPQVGGVELGPTTLKQLVESFVSERVRGGNWTARSQREYQTVFNLLFDILSSDMHCSTIDISTARRVKETLQLVPKNIKTSSRTRDLTFEDAIALSGVERMHVKTINKHLAAYNGLFKWAEENGYVDKNVFAGLSIKHKKSVEQARAAFTTAHAKVIRDAVIGNEQGLIKKGYQKWGPLIGLYTGARLNEIAQLRLADIRKVDDIWCFDINDEGQGSRLKTASAKRLIPVHSELIRLGLIEYANGLKVAGKTRLLHELEHSRGTGYGRNLSRWFNGPFLKALGLDNQGLVFHSFRHAMVTNLLQSGVAEPLAKSIVGHAQDGVTQTVYFGTGYTVAQKKAALEGLSWN